MVFEYLYPKRSMLAMRDVRRRFLTRDEILIPGGSYIPLEDGDLWRRRRTRHLARRMHSWLFYYYLRPFHDADDELIITKLLDLLRGWRETVQLPPSRIPMSYHDEATAQRTIALSCLLSDYSDYLADDDGAIVGQVLSEGADLLASDQFYSAGTNHGMYQDLALVVVGHHLPDSSRLTELAIQRLNHYFTNAFTPDGIHKEQSPEYHCLVSSHLKQYVEFLATRDPGTAARLREVWEQTQTYAMMSISPIGKFAPVSDIANKPVISFGHSRTYPAPEFLYAQSQGAAGTAPEINHLHATETGVAIYREKWDDLDSVYLYFSAAYNSDYHKHSDELSVYLVHRGVELLREAGANGYEMGDPFTQYAFSSFAHNTLIVSGEGLPRTDPQAMDHVGIQRPDVEPGVDFCVRGWNRRYPGVEHQRELSFVTSEGESPGKMLTVDDTVSGQDRSEYQLLWHFGPDVTVELRGRTVLVTDRDQVPLARLSITADCDTDLCLVRGQTQPMIQGWYFPTMGVREPASTLTVSFAAEKAALRTEFTLF